ncbi:MAG: YihA family ribosome biogenesis GTP-binding protein [Saprospiraceae bacterium]|nr:YihA family ribosome biogenesis GTP-binding protein [Saprospiraceae bacterium]
MSKQLNISFIGSFSTYKSCPENNLPEYAFIGRSNVGKSSLVNMLSGKTNIAKVSNTPGKTQLINLFEVDKEWHIVDLPGYGYAKSSKANRAAWSKMVTDYLKGRKNLVLLFVLIDSRLPAQKIDLDFMEFCGKNNIPFSIIYTKSDKSSFNQLNKQIADIRKTILQYWSSMPDEFVSSSQNKTGREEILEYIYTINEQFHVR